MHKNQIYKNLIFTHHALERIRQRGLSTSDIWATWHHPDSSSKANSKGAYVFYRRYPNQQIKVVAQKNRHNQWVIISAWSKPLSKSSSSSFIQSIRRLITRIFFQ